ncbi:MAG: glycosyltransferase family 4 protein [Bacteroidales bacterium]
MDFIKTLPHLVLGNDVLPFILSFCTALIIAHVSIPTIVHIARAKNLFDEPNARASHQVRTPTFGGTAIFSGLIISAMIFMDLSRPETSYIQYVIAGSLIIFLIGLKDDILSISPLKKLIGQFIAAGILIDLGNIRFTNLHGFCGIYEINYFVSAILSLFVIIVIINSFNLIDGVDGLASGIGMVCTLTFGVWFFLIGHTQLAILALALTGGLLGFFWFNVFSKDNKIFMGDTGSLLLGYFISVLVIKFNELNIGLSHELATNAAPAVSIGILIVPLFDTIRVFMIRILRGRSPFSPDKNHVHHRLLKLFNSHKKTSATIIGINLCFVALCYFLRSWDIISLLLLLLVLAAGFSYYPVIRIQQRQKKVITKTER